MSVFAESATAISSARLAVAGRSWISLGPPLYPLYVAVTKHLFKSLRNRDFGFVACDTYDHRTAGVCNGVVSAGLRLLLSRLATCTGCLAAALFVAEIVSSADVRLSSDLVLTPSS